MSESIVKSCIDAEAGTSGDAQGEQPEEQRADRLPARVDSEPWTKKYRPRRVADLILPASLKQNFQEIVASGVIPNLLLVGKPGTGKTSAVKAMLREIGAEQCSYTINASKDGGIDTLRNDIEVFASGASLWDERKYVILEEADHLTSAMQAGLRVPMEDYAGNCGFILTANLENKIIEPLRSRLSVIEFGNYEPEHEAELLPQYQARVRSILEQERIPYDDSVVSALVLSLFPDLRKVLNELETYSRIGRIDAELLFRLGIADRQEWLKRHRPPIGSGPKGAGEDISSTPVVTGVHLVPGDCEGHESVASHDVISQSANLGAAPAEQQLPPVDHDPAESKATPPDADAPGIDTPVGDPDAADAPAGSPGGETVDGAQLLRDLAATFPRYIVLPPGGAETLALWVLSAHLHDAAQISPLLALQSPDMRCGKTTSLSLLGALVPRPLATSNITPAALYRAIEEDSPTLLIDEADTFVRKNSELIGILNSGHMRDAAYVIRTDGPNRAARAFSTWCPKVIATIGPLPGTLADRSIRILLRRRRKDETVESWRLKSRQELAPLLRKVVRWAADNRHALSQDPAMPPELNDRDADNWSRLVAIADKVGGEWPATARRVAVMLSLGADTESASGALLTDIRAVFKELKADRLFSEVLVKELAKLEGRPWSDGSNGWPITKNKLARLLRPFDIRPRTVRDGTETAKGYYLSQFEDAFARYAA